jgi:hypothetical protein
MKIALAFSALLFATTLATAQQAERGDASKDLTNCPPSAAQNSTTGTASPDAQAVEKSAIVPSAEGHENSAAPTVQRNGEAVEVRSDCPQDASQPKPKS